MGPSNQTDAPKYSPGPWARGLMYSLLGLGALAYGHVTGERPLNIVNGVILGAVAVAAGIVAAVLQTWARNARDDSQS